MARLRADESSMEIDLTVPETDTATRLDAWISRAVPHCTRRLAAALVQNGEIRVSGQTKRPGYRIKAGERITGLIPERDTEPAPPVPEPLDLDICYEDGHVMVINKPAGMVVHPAAGNHSGTLVNGLLFYNPGLDGVGDDPLRPGIVHRLDMDTSGLIVVAKTRRSLAFLQKEFRQRRVKKRYRALVAGQDLADTGEIDLPIARHPVKRKMMAVNRETGKPARTSWQVLQRFADTCLVSVRLHTGRTHQIRVHFYHMGHPLLGDRVYQHRRFRRKKQPVSRQMLHAEALAFRHPYSGLKMRFSAPLPLDFRKQVAKLSGRV